MPQLNFLDEIEKLKGSKLTKEEKAEAGMRVKYAQKWLEDYAGENDKFTVQEKLPELLKLFQPTRKISRRHRRAFKRKRLERRRASCRDPRT